MTNWQSSLAKLVRYYKLHGGEEDPFFLYNPTPPASSEWPAELPASQPLQTFYRLCDGGEWGPMIRFIPLVNLARETARWIEQLRNYDMRGDVLKVGQHIVFANDADGTPWILDVISGRVASFYWKGGDWEEPSFDSFDSFMQHIFDDSAHDESWTAVLRRVNSKGL